MKSKLSFIFALGLVLPVCAMATDVGLYDATDQSAPDYDVASRVIEGGGTPVDVDTPNAAALTGLGVFMVFVDNSGYSAEWDANLADIDAAVNAGLVLIVHDRAIGNNGTETRVPGAASISFSTSSPDDDVRVITPATLIVNGPGGPIFDDTLDTGNSSYHGTMDATTLPGGSVVHLSRQFEANDGVTVEWPLGSGLVIYSGIPLDCYQTGENCDFDLGNTDDPFFKYTYTPNVIAYAVDRANGGDGSAPAPVVPAVPALNTLGLLLMAGLLALFGVAMVRSRA